MFDETVDNEYEDLPAAEHVDTMMDAVIDTVSGNEGISFAQHYAHGVLGASGSLSSRTGVEGFFDSVGAGLKAVWEYIKKMFKAIWGFFFGDSDKSAKASSKKVKVKVDEVVEGLKEAKEPPKTTEEGNKKIAEVKTKVKQVASNPKASSSDKSHAAAIVVKLDEAKDKPPAEQGRVIKESMNALVKLDWERNQLEGQLNHWDSIYKDWEESTLNTIEGVDWKNSPLGKEYEAFATSIRSHFPEMRKSSIALFPKTLNGIDDAIKALEKMSNDNKEWGVEGSIGKLTTNYVKKLEDTISKLEGQSSQNKEDKALTEELNVAKAVLKLANNLATIAYKEADLAYGVACTLDLGFKPSQRK